MLTAHMVQHLLLMTFAPPLILLGVPLKTLVYGLPHRLVQVMRRSFQSTGLHQVWSVLTHPAICWLGAAGTLVAWHIPSVFMLGLRSQMWHGIEQASFLATGLLFWWPVVQPLPNSLKWPESSHTLVSVPGYLAVRYSFRISGLLRPCGLPGVICPHRNRLDYPLWRTSNARVR